MNEHMPAWRAAWHLDDPEWVKQRKQNWKRMKNSPAVESLFMPNKDELKKIKNFYLTGSAFDPEPAEKDWRWNNYHPDTRPVPISKAMLLELWLTADDSEENWQHIYDKYTNSHHRDARWAFRDALHRLYPEYGSIFDGREARIYRLLGPTRCRPEDYPDLSDDLFRKISKSENSMIGAPIKALLTEDNRSIDDFVPTLAREWCDTVPGAYEFAESVSSERPKLLPTLVKGLEKAFAKASMISREPERFASSQVQLAENIIAFLSEMTLPKQLDDVLGEYLDDRE